MPIVSGTYQAPTWVNDSAPAINATELQAISDTLELVPVANGGTGVTSLASLKTALGIDTVAIANGGTGATTAAGARSNLGLGNTTGALPIANGGTGKTTASDALTALGGVPKTNVTSKGSATRPVYFNASGVAVQTTYSLNKTVPSDAVFTDTKALGSMTGTLGIAHGGTGATTAQGACDNLIQYKIHLGSGNLRSYGTSLPALADAEIGRLFFLKV